MRKCKSYVATRRVMVEKSPFMVEFVYAGQMYMPILRALVQNYDSINYQVMEEKHNNIFLLKNLYKKVKSN